MRMPFFLVSARRLQGRPLRLARLSLLVLLSVAAYGLAVPATAQAAQASAAADVCAQAASRAGFAKGQRLVVAVAVGMAESSCNPRAHLHNGATRGCAHGSTDRGLWQVNSCARTPT